MARFDLMLKMSKAFVVRMALWSVLMLYLVGDFFLFNGPLRGELRRMFPSSEDKVAEAMAEGICARVYNAPIYLSQVDRRVTERLWRTGRDPKRVSEAERKMLRWLALEDLIAEALVRIKVRVNSERQRFPRRRWMMSWRGLRAALILPQSWIMRLPPRVSKAEKSYGYVCRRVWSRRSMYYPRSRPVLR